MQLLIDLIIHYTGYNTSIDHLQCDNCPEVLQLKVMSFLVSLTMQKIVQTHIFQWYSRPLSHPLHLAVELPHAAVPLLLLPVEVLQQLGPLAAPPLLPVLQLPAEVQGGAVALGQQTPVLLAFQVQGPLGVSSRLVSLRLTSHFALHLLLQLVKRAKTQVSIILHSKYRKK